MSSSFTFFTSTPLVFFSAFVLRAVLLTYGIYQDSVSALKYTDIDYYVFTDAARAVFHHSSPYDRATYRYTPLLAWLLLPTAWDGLWFQFGKALFAISDLIAGWLIFTLLKRRSLSKQRALKYASVWLLNPMVASISTRGSSEGFLCVLVLLLLWAFETRRIVLSGALLGLCVHFKIYPFIYGASMIWTLQNKSPLPHSANIIQQVQHFITTSRITLILISLTTFMALNALMYTLYGFPFLQHTFFHHLTRIDHRHNFSPYNALLYLSSANTALLPKSAVKTLSFESLAFIPQITLSAIILPFVLSSIDLPTTMFAQTLAFVTFNKVCTSQYFLWYLVFLPLYLPTSRLRSYPRLGLTALVLWILGQALWLQQGYQLEFLGHSTFFPGLWLASLIFFEINCWILGIIVQDVLTQKTAIPRNPPQKTLSNAPLNPAPIPSTASAGRDRKSSISGTKMGNAHLGPRNRVLKSSPQGGY